MNRRDDEHPGTTAADQGVDTTSEGLSQARARGAVELDAGLRHLADAAADPETFARMVASGLWTAHDVSRECRPHSAAARRYVRFRLDRITCTCGALDQVRELILDCVYGRSGSPPIVGERFIRRALWLEYRDDDAEDGD